MTKLFFKFIRKCALVWLLFQNLCSFGQYRSVEFRIFDADTGHAIHQAHAFIANSTFGAISDTNGICRIILPEAIRDPLVISHISYQTRFITSEDYLLLQLLDTVFLYSNHIDLAQIIISEKRSKQWEKKYRKFCETLLGTDQVASQCEILNPEVLRFNETEGRFYAFALDLIQIENKYLNYRLYFLLNELTIEPDGSSFYSGRARFYDLNEDKNVRKFTDRRNELYRQGAKYFYSSLIENSLKENGFIVRTVRYIRDRFEVISAPSRNELLQTDTISSRFHLYFQEFLEVTNKKIRSIAINRTDPMSRGLESQRINNLRDESNRSQVTYATSYLYKTAPFLIVDPSGNLINQSDVKEYGFWADLRLAHQLPIDFEFSEN